jgi:polysaccharide export outer membrane protein
MQMGKVLKSPGLRLTLGVAVMLGAGCSQMPTTGPSSREVVDSDNAQANVYVVVDLTPSVVDKLSKMSPAALTDSFGSVPSAPPQALGVGDTVSVTIWESASGGLFFNQQAGSSSTPPLMPLPIPAPSGGGVLAPSGGARFVTLPTQMVDLKGEITVPYAGQVAVSGLTPAQAQQKIERGLTHKALQPQVMLSVLQSQSNVVTASGDVNQPQRLPLFLEGSRILDVIAQAGGSKWPAYDSAVQLTRNGISRRVPMRELLANPADNIVLQGGDMVYVYRQPQTVAVLGAITTNALVPFDTERMTLAEALAKAGGLNDNIANQRGLFVFRFQSSDQVRQLVPEAGKMTLPDRVPVAFHVNLEQGGTLFLTESFEMNDKDLVYVADADAAQLAKLASLVRNTAQIFQSRGVFIGN